jgi:hypothetical protein
MAPRSPQADNSSEVTGVQEALIVTPTPIGDIGVGRLELRPASRTMPAHSEITVLICESSAPVVTSMPVACSWAGGTCTQRVPTSVGRC